LLFAQGLDLPLIMFNGKVASVKLTRTIPAAPKRSPHVSANGSRMPVRRVNRGKLDRLAGRWPAAEADRIAAFISENCESVHEEN
jgi:hypothetical protein